VTVPSYDASAGGSPGEFDASKTITVAGIGGPNNYMLVGVISTAIDGASAGGGGKRGTGCTIGGVAATLLETAENAAVSNGLCLQVYGRICGTGSVDAVVSLSVDGDGRRTAILATAIKDMDQSTPVTLAQIQKALAFPGATVSVVSDATSGLVWSFGGVRFNAAPTTANTQRGATQASASYGGAAGCSVSAASAPGAASVDMDWNGDYTAIIGIPLNGGGGSPPPFAPGGGYVAVCTNPATAAGGEIKSVDDVLGTDYVATCTNTATAAGDGWKQVDDLVDADLVPLASAPSGAFFGQWCAGPSRQVSADPPPPDLTTYAHGERYFTQPVHTPPTGWGYDDPNNLLSLVDSNTGHAQEFLTSLPPGNSPASEFIYLGGEPHYGILNTHEFKFGANWSGQSPTGINKVLYLLIGDDYRVFTSLRGVGSADLQPYVSLQAVVGVSGLSGGELDPLPANINPSVVVPRDVPAQFMIWGFANTPGNFDGSIVWWVNGIKIGSYVGRVQFGDTSGARWTWGAANWTPVYGGAGSGPPHTQYMTTYYMLNQWKDTEL